MDNTNYRMVIERTFKSPEGKISQSPLYLAGPSGSVDPKQLFVEECERNPGYLIKYEYGETILVNYTDLNSLP